MFFGILIFDPNRQFWKMVDFAAKWSHFWNIWCFFERFLCRELLQCGCTIDSMGIFVLTCWNNYLPMNRNLSKVSFVSPKWYHLLFAQFLKLRKSSYINIKRTIFYSVVKYGFFPLTATYNITH